MLKNKKTGEVMVVDWLERGAVRAFTFRNEEEAKLDGKDKCVKKVPFNRGINHETLEKLSKKTVKSGSSLQSAMADVAEELMLEQEDVSKEWENLSK